MVKGELTRNARINAFNLIINQVQKRDVLSEMMLE